MQELKKEFILNFIEDNRWKYIVDGLKITLIVTIFAVLIGVLLGFLIAIVRTTHDKTGKLKILNAICKVYLTVIRGTPVVVQLMIIYFIIFGSVDISKVLVAIIAFGSAIMAFQILRDLKAPDEDIAVIVSAIGQHDEATGMAVDAVSAALILADKTDVRRNRVRNTIKESFDKHDRVNYAAVASSLHVNVEKQVILLEIELDEGICSILDYFEIFLQRMLMCKRAAEMLGMKFKMKANGNKIC